VLTQPVINFFFIKSNDMNIHLITTDSNCFDLFERTHVGTNINCVIVPENRIKSEKVINVIEHAEARKIPVSIHQKNSYFADSLPPASVAISWFYSQIIKPEDLACYSTGILNMHGGKIPEYRGASVMHWSIINGESELGVTWHRMVEKVDAGPILAEDVIQIPPEASAWEMRQILIDKAINIFPEAWWHLVQNIEVRDPDLTQGKIWPQRKPLDSCIGNGWTERRVKDLVRANCSPWPRAYIERDDEKFEIEKVVSVSQPDTISYSTDGGKIIYLKKVNP